MTYHRYSQLLSLLREIYTALYHCPPPVGPRTAHRYSRLRRILWLVQDRLVDGFHEGYLDNGRGEWPPRLASAVSDWNISVELEGDR